MVLERPKNEEALQDAKSCKGVSGRMPSEIILTQKERPTPMVGMVLDAEEEKWGTNFSLCYCGALWCTVTSCLKLRLPSSRDGTISSNGEPQ